jgi:C-terminal processing protease CtpA/Prc
MAITIAHATTEPPPPASAQITSHSSHSSASSNFGSLACITVRKDDPSAKAGIQLEQDSNGQVTVTNIAKNGLFGDTDLAIGDVVLAVNKKRLSQGEGPEILMNVVHKNATICIAVKKPAKAGTPLMSSRNRKKKPSSSNSNSNSNSNFSSSSFSFSSSSFSSNFSNSSHHKKPPPSSSRNRNRNNNSVKIDTYDGGMAQHNADGSLAFQKVGEPSIEKAPTKTLTVSAFKAEATNSSGNHQRRSFGSSLRSQSKSPHANRKRLDSKTTHNININNSSSSSSSSKQCVGLELGIVDKQLVVEAILAKSIFRSTKLRLGDHILSINDMSFRKFADADYAKIIMDKARLMVTLVVERPMDDCADTDNEENNGDNDDDDDDDKSIYSFGNYDDDDDENYDADESEALSTNSFANNKSTHSNSNNNSNNNIIETDFKIERYRPVTISVPKSRKSQDAGLVFKMVRTKKQGLYNPTISHLHEDAPAPPQTSSPSVMRNTKKTTWIYVDKIEPDSIFKQTSLRKGDKIVCINNVNLKENPDPRAAYQACYDSKESIAMVVLKDDKSIYKEKVFEFDRSSSDLDWKA